MKFNENDFIVDIEGESANLDNGIVGFVCLDHICSGYFNEDEDVKIVYMLADMLSVYLAAKDIILDF